MSLNGGSRGCGDRGGRIGGVIRHHWGSGREKELGVGEANGGKFESWSRHGSRLGVNLRTAERER